MGYAFLLAGCGEHSTVTRAWESLKLLRRGVKTECAVLVMCAYCPGYLTGRGRKTELGNWEQQDLKGRKRKKKKGGLGDATRLVECWGSV